MRRLTYFWSNLLVLMLLACAGCSSEESELPQAAMDQASGSGGALAASTPVDAEVEFDNEYPVLAIATSRGTIKVKLDAVRSPLSADSFLWSAANGRFNGTIFHQVEDGYIVAGGEYDKNLERLPSSMTIRNEADNGMSNKRGTVALTRDPSMIDSSSGSFFFNLTDNAHLDHKSAESADKFGYCVFGEVIEGMEVLDKIGAVQVSAQGDLAQVPLEPIEIQSIKRLR